MSMIKTTPDLNIFIQKARQNDFVTIDTEFLRERTYWPKLCLVQIATQDEAVAIDPLAKDIDLSSLYELLSDTSVLKVFHAGRQDLEIFWHLAQTIPTPLFDTQVAAMVCGYGDSVGYDTLVRKITKEKIDKSSRFSDWTKRPLSQKQLSYALSDVTHLRDVYISLSTQLQREDRIEWMEDELNILRNPATYHVEPDEAWKRVKVRARSGREMARIKLLAQWREELAQSEDVPRSRILKDDALQVIASTNSSTPEELMSQRGIQGSLRSKFATQLIDILAQANAIDEADLPPLPVRRNNQDTQTPAIELLRVALKKVADDLGVSSRLIANSDDLDQFARGENLNAISIMHGWRYKVFGELAQKVMSGEMHLCMQNGAVAIVNPDGSKPNET